MRRIFAVILTLLTILGLSGGSAEACNSRPIVKPKPSVAIPLQTLDDFVYNKLGLVGTQNGLFKTYWLDNGGPTKWNTFRHPLSTVDPFQCLALHLYVYGSLCYLSVNSMDAAGVSDPWRTISIGSANAGTTKVTGVAVPALLHWPYSVVYIEDRSSTLWPVTNATHDWNSGTDLTVLVGKCRVNAGCVRVYQGAYGKTGWIGHTDWTYQGTTIRTMKIRMNNTYSSYGPRNRRVAMCHELGHSMGFTGHNNSTTSCRFHRVGGDVSQYPNAADKAALNKIY